MKIFAEKTTHKPQSVLMLLLFVFVLLNQGGYFKGCIAAAGLVGAVALFWCKIRLDLSKIIGLIYAGWYFFCSMQNGFVIENAAKGLLPFAAVVFLFLAENATDKSNLLKSIIKLSAAIAVVSIVHCAVMSVGALSLKRALFPFWYSNACGIYFAAMYFLSAHSEGKKSLRFIFLIALLLTQSVGAVGVLAIAEITYDKSIKKTAVIIISAALLAIFFKDRVCESFETFIERLLQIYDGIHCTLKNPIFGIGAESWKNAKQIYQSGFYLATVIHSSPVQVAVSSGIIGLVLFWAYIVFTFISIDKKAKKELFCIAMLLFHSLFDLSLSFLAIDMLLMLLVAKSEKAEEKSIVPTLLLKYSVVGLTVLLFAFCTSNLYKINKITHAHNNRFLKQYECNILLQHSEEAKEKYIKTLYSAGEYEKVLASATTIKYPSTEIILIISGCKPNREEVIKDYLVSQPYNTKLYHALNDKKESEKIKNNAIPAMSQLGKFLYQRKGENL